ncbi:MAG TPA: ATP synthase F1 subunit epsilon [Candidatus Eisenbacteria bacterium]
MAEFKFRLVTPQRLLFEGPVSFVQAPGSEGYLGILAHHAPLITALRPGKLEVKDPHGAVTTYAVSGGFLEVSGNRASVLADAAERVTEIDRARAAAAFERAQARLQGRGEPIDHFDRDRAARAFDRAKNRLAMAGGAKQQ